MKNKLSFGYLLRAWLITMSCAGPLMLSAVTLTNPGFESDFTGWTDTDPSAISTSDVHSGSKAAKITGSAGRVEQTVSVSQNTDYVLTAWVYEQGKIGAVVGSNDYNDSGNYGSYTEVEVTFNSGSQTSVTIYAAYNGGTGRFDDFALEEDTSGGGSEELLSIEAVDASSNDGNVPANTLDSSLSTRWSAEGDGEWIRYELEEEADVTSIDIAWHQGDQRTADFEVQVSSNGTSWTTVLSLTSSSGSTLNLETYDVTDTVASWVRIVGYGNSSNDWNSITEVEIYGEPTGSGGGGSGDIDFSSVSTTAYGNNGGSYQDGSGSLQSQDSGATLYLDGNRWRDVPFSYTVTVDTVLEFDFKSTDEAEIQAIGFDNDDDQENALRAFYLYGSQGWNNSYDDQSTPSVTAYGGSGSWVTYTIYVGDFYTGSFDRIFFVNDGDSNTGNSYFRNVSVFEDSGASVPSITTTSLPDATQNVSYSQTLAATGGNGTLTWSVGSGLPSGISLSSSGVLSGTTSSTGTFNFTVTVTDADSDSDNQALSLTVNTQGSVDLPSDVLDLTNWKITIPFDENGNDGPTNSADEVKQPDLDDYELPGYFEVNSTEDGVIFLAHAGGATTSGSGYPRCELREMTNSGASNANWSSGSGTHSMFIRQAVNHLPVEKPHVVVGQIHDSSDDVTVFRLEGNKLYVTDGDGKVTPAIDDNYQLGTEFTVEFVVQNNQTKLYYNGNLVHTLDQSYSGAYFKAGCYTQSACDGPKEVSGESCSAYAEVEIFELEVTHN